MFCIRINIFYSYTVLPWRSSWVSHYPTDGRTWGRVTGLGMNAEELAKNPQLNFWEVCALELKKKIKKKSAASLLGGVRSCVFELFGCCQVLELSNYL